MTLSVFGRPYWTPEEMDDALFEAWRPVVEPRRHGCDRPWCLRGTVHETRSYTSTILDAGEAAAAGTGGGIAVASG